MKVVALVLAVATLLGDLVPTNTPGEYFDTVNNNICRAITATITVGPSGVNVVVGAPSASASIVTGVTGVADLSVKATSVTQTFAQIQKAGNLTVPIVIQAAGNTTATTGYQVIWSMLFPLINVNLTSTNFFQLQIPPVSPSTSAILYCNMYYGTAVADYWLLTQPQGLTISQSWKSNIILASKTEAASTITFSLVVPYASVANLAQGVYWMNTFLIMSAPSTNTGLVANQIAVLTGLVNEGNNLISGVNNTNFPTASQIATIQANQAFLVKLIQTILKANPHNSSTQVR